MSSTILEGTKRLEKETKAVNVVQSFTLELDANPTTGYLWELVSISDLRVLELMDHHYKPHHPILHGSGGTDVWRFKGLKPGKATISLAYNRPWEPPQPANLQVTVTVTETEIEPEA